MVAIVIISVQILCTVYTHQSFKSIKPLMQALEQPGAHIFSANGSLHMIGARDCLSNVADTGNTIVRNGKLDEKRSIRIIKETIKNFPVHLLKTRMESDYIEVSLLYNMPKPLILTYRMKPSNEGYQIDSIGNICELFKIVKLYTGSKNVRWQKEK